ncbi:polysaccharide deacetylase family protein [Ferruginibacter sp.]|nr:polysaccharide deacetylase family protein [Ferruginibacter sp.]
MDPDREAEQVASQILRTSFITVVFTACNYYKTETTASVNTIQFSLPDSASKTAVPSLPKKKTKTIYLTFDDGPNKGTKKMMHVVQEEQIPVTLFIVGQHVYGSKEQAAIFDSLVASKYFEIANHSYTHAFQNKFAKFYTVPDSALKDFVRCADSLHLTANIVRTPGRNIWRTATVSSTDINSSKSAADSLYKNGLTQVGWDLEWHYNDTLKLTNSSDEMLLQVDSMFAHNKTKTPDHLIILAHDQVYADAADSAELHQFIIRLKQKEEYNFEMVSKYPRLKN